MKKSYCSPRRLLLGSIFIYGPGIDEPIAMNVLTGPRSGLYFYYYDGLGSVVALSNTSDQIVEQYRYDAFGNTKVFDGSGTAKTVSKLIGNPYMFTGRRVDTETCYATPESIGLYHYRARMYNPRLGRFLQTDPIGYADSMNLYQYCGNNPVNWVDPWGLRSIALYSTEDDSAAYRWQGANDYDHYHGVKDMRNALRILRAYARRGIYFDDIYIFGHGNEKSQDFGSENVKGCDKRWKMVGNKLKEGGKLHLRGCWTADHNQIFLQEVAKLANRNVTGFTGKVSHYLIPSPLSPDYSGAGELWEASPDGSKELISAERGWNEVWPFRRYRR